jgi:hypothetical protein
MTLPLTKVFDGSSTLVVRSFADVSRTESLGSSHREFSLA